MFNNNFEFTIKNVKKDCDGNLIAIDMKIEGNNITLINIYGPNSDNPDFYEKVKEHFLHFDEYGYFILCRDFNLVLNSSLDSYNYSSIKNPKAREKLFEIMDDLQLLDYFRVLNPDKNPLKQSRLDYILISESLSNLVENIK